MASTIVKRIHAVLANLHVTCIYMYLPHVDIGENLFATARKKGLPMHWCKKFESLDVTSQKAKIQEKIIISQFTSKPSITKILERCLLIGKKALYKFPIDIASKLSTLNFSKLLKRP